MGRATKKGEIVVETSRKDYNMSSDEMQVPFRIDPEFKNEIPKIKEEEYKQLYNNILEAGEVYEPLVVWNGVLVDGHNRWNIILELKEKRIIIRYRIREVNFDNNHAAKAWMWKQQRGRRNLTDEQQEYAIGKQLEEEKLAIGTPKKVQNGPLREKGKTAQKIANENGIGYGSVFRAEKFAKGIDALREISPASADKVLDGKTGATKADVRELATAEPAIVEAFARAIEENKKPVRPKRPPKTEEEKRNLAEIEAIVADMRDPTTTPEFTINYLIEDIELNGQAYVELLANTLADRKNLATDENKPLIVAAINKVVESILNVRDSI